MLFGLIGMKSFVTGLADASHVDGCVHIISRCDVASKTLVCKRSRIRDATGQAGIYYKDHRKSLEALHIKYEQLI